MPNKKSLSPTATADLRKCNNCGGHAPVRVMLTMSSANRIVANICPECQQAKKIQITLQKTKQGNWKYYQYFPVEA